MKISIITVTYNSEQYIEHALQSVQEQDYPDIEHIVVDGDSKDNTVKVINKYAANTNRPVKYISEPDKGIYDAMNKGIRMATGEAIGILNSDDFYAHKEVISRVANIYKNENTQVVIGDIVFVKPTNLNRVVRNYSAKKWHPGKFAWGYMPAHPSCFIKKKCFEKYGDYKTDYQIAADYELLIRFLQVHRLPYHYMPEVVVKMRIGGASTKNWKSNVILNEEIIRGCRENGMPTNRIKVYSKYFKKVFELINRG
ncbi:MAG TPA: glycosyl transferase [Cytophagales bacterium]|jgi:glycosyltransferase involved in cell wall biosynthesis|nr:glycosyl transferase [Cytophagales bacterium]